MENFKDYKRNHDLVMILAHGFSDDIAYCIYSGARRQEGQETLQIPQHQEGSEFHTWISFVSDELTSISMSSYVGKITYEMSGLFFFSTNKIADALRS